jgi:hypothetical protein
LLDKKGVAEFLTKIRGYKIFKSHSYPVQEGLPSKIKFVTIYRDPRDVIVSSIFFLAYLEEEKGGWGEQFRKLTEQERIISFVEKGEFCISRLEEWFKAPGVCKIRYEDLKTEPVAALTVILNYLNLTIDDKSVETVILKHSFRARSGRDPGDEKENAFLRKGIIGDWRNYFDDDCVAAFKAAKSGRWNHLLVDMGYEKALDW